MGDFVSCIASHTFVLCACLCIGRCRQAAPPRNLAYLEEINVEDGRTNHWKSMATGEGDRVPSVKRYIQGLSQYFVEQLFYAPLAGGDGTAAAMLPSW